MEEVMKAGPGMHQMVQNMDLESMREGVSRGSHFWWVLAGVIVVFAVLAIFFRLSMRRVADQRTRRIILESMADDDPLAPEDRPQGPNDRKTS